MTRINKLVMHGFKSFAKRTELVFGEKFNCVLGPNGSGKSNILDALCFVLGKSSAKALRSEKSANLIYNGGKAKKPSSHAEVSIYFCNKNKIFPTDDEEVKVTRIVKPTGVSKYKINDEARTRQQIIELLSLARINPDSYNIILQGDIVSFVEMSPDDRRKLVEDIAGISVYEEKKQKAINELSKVDERLKESEIVLSERKTRLTELKKERDQATKFKDLNDKIKINKASLLYAQIKRQSAEKGELDKKIDSNKTQLEEKQKVLDELKDSVKKQREEIDAINKEIEEKGEKEQVTIHKEVEKLKVNIASSSNRIESITAEVGKIAERKKQLAQNIGDVDSKIKELTKEKTELENQIKVRDNDMGVLNKRLEDFRKKNNLDGATTIEKEVDDIDKNLEIKEKQIQELRQKQQEAMREKDRIEFQIQAIDEKIDKVLEVEKENKDQIKDLKQKRQEFKKATLELNQCLNEDSSLAAQLANARRSTLISQEELSKLNAKNISIREAIGSNNALKSIMEQKSKIDGIMGTVSELGKVSSKYALSLEIAAGNKMKSVVVADDRVAAQCIKYLKDKRLGVATFLPLSKVKGIKPHPEMDSLKKSNGVHGRAVDLVEFDHKYKNVFSYVFGNTLVVDNIDVARRIGVGKAKMVTLDGDLTEISGAMRGGYRMRKKGEGFGFQQQELSQEIEKHEGLLADAQATISGLERKKNENEEKIVKLREFKANMEGDIIKLEKTLNLSGGDVDVSRKEKEGLSTNLTKASKSVDEFTGKISELNKELAENKINKQKLRMKINELRNPALIAEMNAFEEKKQQLREQIVKRQSDMENLNSQIGNILSPEIENIQKVIKQHEKEETDFKNEKTSLTELIATMNVDLKDKESKQKKFHSQFKDLFTNRTKIEDKIKKDEKKVEDTAEHHRKVELRMNTLSLELTKVRAELTAVENEYKEYEGVKLDESKQEQTLRKEIGIWEGVITRIGSVNMRALEIYDSMEQEYTKLTSKKEKLMLEKEDVLVMMNEIEVKKTELFMTNFDIVNQQFKNTFSELTTKGDASLVLESPESPFEGGMLIKVRLTGKKFMDIRSLSGGEKTLTALAFIFAIQEHDPASFYVMDEVDAALDKKNSERLAHLVRNYTDKAQYVVISHNDGVISEADILYGVSMNEHGMSNVTSLRL